MMLERGTRHWAVAVPVRLRYDGDLRAGQIVVLGELKLLDCREAAVC